MHHVFAKGMTGLTRNRRKVSKKSGSQARSVDAAHTANAQDVTPRRAALALISKPRTWIAASVAVAIVVFGGFASWFLVSGARNAPANTAAGSAAAATFVGSKTCASCHEAEAKLWRTSQHKLAMDHATDRSVLGDFSGATAEHYGVKSRFFRKDGKYLVETDGPNGKPGMFEIKYTFSSTRSASIRFSNIWSNLPTVDCRRSRWPGTAGRRRREVSAGSTFIPMRRSATMISCIGPS